MMIRFLAFVLFVASTGIFASGAKAPWTSDEDEFIATYVAEHGPKNWTAIAGVLNDTLHKDDEYERIGKQCRERWHNQLNPDIKKGDWTGEENELIISAVLCKYGKRWAVISREIFNGERTDNDIKNHWNSTLSKRVDSRLIPEKKIHTAKTPSKRRKKEPEVARLKSKADSGDESQDDDSDEGVKLKIPPRATDRSSRYPTRTRSAPEYFTVSLAKVRVSKRSWKDSDEESSDDEETLPSEQASDEVTPTLLGVTFPFNLLDEPLSNSPTSSPFFKDDISQPDPWNAPLPLQPPLSPWLPLDSHNSSNNWSLFDEEDQPEPPVAANASSHPLLPSDDLADWLMQPSHNPPLFNHELTSAGDSDWAQ